LPKSNSVTCHAEVAALIAVVEVLRRRFPLVSSLFCCFTMVKETCQRLQLQEMKNCEPHFKLRFLTVKVSFINAVRMIEPNTWVLHNQNLSLSAG